MNYFMTVIVKKILNRQRTIQLCRGCGHKNKSLAKFCGRCGIASRPYHSGYLLRGLVYSFYALILLAALTWRFAYAAPVPAKMLAFSIKENAEVTDLLIKLNTSQRPLLVLSAVENSLTLDFSNTTVDNSLLAKAFTGNRLRLAYFVDNKNARKMARVKLFAQPGCLPVVKYRQNDVIIRLSAKTPAVNKKKTAMRHLINPFDEKNAPVAISLQEAPLAPAVLELAAKAGLDIKFALGLPETFSLEIDAPTPLEAIRAIADTSGLTFRRQGKYWLLAPKFNRSPGVAIAAVEKP